MYKYNWQQPDWPNFQYDLSVLYDDLLRITEKMGFISGKLAHFTENLQTEAMLDFMVEEAVKTSAIEGEYVSRPDVRLSIKNGLGLDREKLRVHDRRARGIAELMLDVRNTFKESITDTKLFSWHLMLLSSSINPNLRVGSWRIHEEPMQVVSGNYTRSIVHYEAPPSKDVPKEMERFIQWFNDTAPEKPQAIKFPPVRAAIAHLYFESIHPFEDGNGRIGRAIAEKSLSQSFGCPMLLSLSQAIEAKKSDYYAALHLASTSNEITAWIRYFVSIILQAQQEVETYIDFVLKKAAFFDRFSDLLNERQLKVVQRMMKEGPKGFEGGMSAKKYMVIADTSKATATRDLQQLHEMQLLKQTGGGRSVRYELNLDRL
ncbi:MAG: cell filamentation protein Fic [Gammaproteobacteria bacterium]|jgi:Fic family protein|nr:cell filamentation protein Fic [Gammaproteobacteria bacterium]